MHPEIELLKRRNRAAGKRLVPIESERRGRSQRPSSCNVNSRAPSSCTARAPQDATQSVERVPGQCSRACSLASRNTATAPTSANRVYNRPNGKVVAANGRPPQMIRPAVPRAPAKPPAGARSRVRNSVGGVVRSSVDVTLPPSRKSGNDVVNLPQGDNKSPLEAFQVPSSGGLSSTSVQPAEERAVGPNGVAHKTVEMLEAEEEECEGGYGGATTSLSDHLSQRAFKPLPDYIRRIMEGDAIEEPYTTSLWEQVNMGESQRGRGYYACIRCAMPLVSPKNQIRYCTRGIAAFSLMHWDGVEVRVGGVNAGRMAQMDTMGNALHLQVRCRCCYGFVGILVPDPDGEPRNIFVVNSCCLDYVRRGATRCNLSSPCGAYGDGDDDSNGANKSRGRTDEGFRDSMDLDFSDLSIFEFD